MGDPLGSMGRPGPTHGDDATKLTVLAGGATETRLAGRATETPTAAPGARDARERPAPPVRPGLAVLVCWEERVTRWVGHGELRLEIPLLGWCTAPEFGYLVGQELQRRWADQTVGGFRVRSVAGYCDERHGSRVLRLLILLHDGPWDDRRIDGIHMARDVREAVRFVSVDR